jgi:parallel beta-helix repeat protein
MRIDRRVLAMAAVVACVLAGWHASTSQLAVAGFTADDIRTPSPAAGSGPAKPQGRVITIKPSTDDQDVAQTALIKAKPGDTIEFSEGTFHFTKSLSLTVEGVTVRGKGIDKTILSFKEQDEGKEGLHVNRGGFLLADLTFQDSKGDGIKVEGGDGVTFRNVKAEWTGGAKASNGAYGVYPVQCKNVLVESCVVIGASDAGIYVGQSTNVVIRKCKAEQNVAGIEIENCVNAEAYDNVTTNNAGGLLVFDLPGLQQKNGHGVKVHNNQVFGNNHANFAPEGNMVASVAPGTGMMVMATDHVELAENTVKDNKTYGLIVISFIVTGRPLEDKEYDPYPESVYIHNNTFDKNGRDPTGPRGKALADLLGTPIPEIVYDGILNPKKLVNGKIPEDQRVVFKDNGPISTVNMHWDQLDPKNMAGSRSKVERNPKSLVGELPPLPSVKLAGVR